MITGFSVCIIHTIYINDVSIAYEQAFCLINASYEMHLNKAIMFLSVVIIMLHQRQTKLRKLRHNRVSGLSSKKYLYIYISKSSDEPIHVAYENFALYKYTGI